MTSSIVDSIASVSELVDNLASIPCSPHSLPSIYIDVEGIYLGRHGSVSIIQLYNHAAKHIYIIDIHTLQNVAFTTSGKTHGTETLKSILESPRIPKVFFDVRNDSDALYSHYGIALQGILDIQLMEIASRSFGRRLLSGLQKCIERDAPITPREKSTWMVIKDRGRRLFAPEEGGSFDVFNERPLKQEIVEYCLQDVQFLPKLYELYHSKLSASWQGMVEAETLKRVRDSQSPAYKGKGSHMSLGPWTESALKRKSRLPAEEALDCLHREFGDLLEDQDRYWDRFDQDLATLLEDQDEEWKRLDQQLSGLLKTREPKMERNTRVGTHL